jgi:hypothetical protein
VTAWDGPRITIISPANKAIAHIPLIFVIQGGDNTWAYVIGVARQLVVEDDGWIFDGLQAVNSVDPPFAGTFVYSFQGKKVSSRSAYAYMGDVVSHTPHYLRSELRELLFWAFLYYALQTSRGRWQSKQSPLLRDNSECSSKFHRP